MKNKQFRSDVIWGMQDGKIDREKGIIYGFKVVELGVTKDRRGEFDEESLKTIINLGNASKIGIKSRFGHPNMSNTAFGTFLGRVKNFRLSENGGAILGDEYLDKTAYKTPNGDLASYTMDLGESDPDAFGSSMVIYWDEEYRKKKDGSLTKDEKGEPLVPLIKVKKLSGVDIVDNPAANEGMFGTFFNDSVKLSAEMTDFLDKFLNNSDAVDKIMDFLQRYSNNRDEFARGKGQGVGKPKQGDGGADNCVCPECNYKTKHERGTPCNEMKCPECGASMTGETTNQNKGEVKKDMDIKELTLETLKADRSDLVDKIQAEGKEEILKEGNAAGEKLERERVVAIQEAVKPYEGMSELANEAIKDGATVDEAVSKFKDKRIADLQENAPKTQGPSDPPEKDKDGGDKLSGEDQWKKNWEKDSKIRDEFKEEGNYLAYMKQKAKGNIKILQKKDE